ncbi:hypothetical protein PENSPDRAFT_609927 [Peniophora sp. CONT]|nr:hypothetical protein PENSPDRAFT_609927 [Peniophora sp. CONT]
MSNPYSPVESSTDLLTEKSWLQGAIISSVAYGAEFVLFCLCLPLLWQQATKSAPKVSKPVTYAMTVYVIVLFCLGTVFQVALAGFTQLAFITDRNFAGGPNGVENTLFSAPIDEGGNVAFVLSVWLCDTLIIWRCVVIYKAASPFLKALTIGFPCLIFLGSFATGILWLIQISTTSPYIAQIVNWTIPFLSLSLAINILVTLFIVSRLLFHRHRIASALGNRYGTQYTSIAAMIVESAAIYSAFSLLFLVPFGLNSPISEIFLQSLGQVQISATFLIIFRVAQGKAWSSSVATQVTTGSSAPSSYPMGTLSFGQRTRSTAVSSGSKAVIELKGSSIGGSSAIGTFPEVRLREDAVVFGEDSKAASMV